MYLYVRRLYGDTYFIEAGAGLVLILVKHMPQVPLLLLKLVFFGVKTLFYNEIVNTLTMFTVHDWMFSYRRTLLYSISD